jgi:uncharacterized membrane protein
MDGHQMLYVINTAIVTSGVLLLVFGLAWIRARNRRFEGPRAPVAIDQRLERMEQAIESVAVEVERISEAHRFTAKLLAERNEQPRQSERVITPR